MSRAKIPKLVGLNWPQAQRTAAAAGYRLLPKMVSDRDRPRLEVLWQRTLWVPEIAEAELRGLAFSEPQLLESKAFDSESLGFESLESEALESGFLESRSLEFGSLEARAVEAGDRESSEILRSLKSLEIGSLERSEALEFGSLEAEALKTGSRESGSLESESLESESLESESLETEYLKPASLAFDSLAASSPKSDVLEPENPESRFLESGALAAGSLESGFQNSESLKSTSKIETPKAEAGKRHPSDHPENSLPILELGIAVPSWLRHLPEVFIDNDQQNGDFLKRLLELFAHLLLPVEKQMAGLAFSLNPRLAAPSELFQLLAWFAPTERGLQSHGQQRDFLCRLPQLWSQLGTVQGLKLALDLWLGLEVGIVEKPPPLSNAGLGSQFRVGIHGAFGSAIPSWQWFIVTIPTKLKKSQLSIAHRIISSYAPAHAHWTLCCTQTESRRPRLPRAFRLGRDRIAEVGG